MENSKGFGQGIPCGAGLDGVCERPRPDFCARHSWRMAALRLLRFAADGGEYTGGRRTSVIEARVATLLHRRGCVGDIAEVPTIGGVALCDAIVHLVSLVDPGGRGPLDPSTGERLAGLDPATIHAAASETLLRVWRAQPKREW